MNLHHLRYFVTLAHLEHYTKAARQLSITQPSLSHAIAALEEELNVRLFEKDGRNVVLTRWGKVFLKDVEEILAHLDSSVANLKMTGSGNGTIDIGCIRVLGASYVPGLMREFIKANPDKNISYRLHSEGGLSAEIIEGLKNRQFDEADLTIGELTIVCDVIASSICRLYHGRPQYAKPKDDDAIRRSFLTDGAGFATSSTHSLPG